MTRPPATIDGDLPQAGSTENQFVRRIFDQRGETLSGTCEKIGFTDFSTTHFQ